jgi:hypothetical protein
MSASKIDQFLEQFYSATHFNLNELFFGGWWVGGGGFLFVGGGQQKKPTAKIHTANQQCHFSRTTTVVEK